MVVGMYGVSMLVRSIVIESWGLFLPGGLAGRARSAFGPNVGAFAAAAALSERVLLAALAAAIVGRYSTDLVVSARTALDFRSEERRVGKEGRRRWGAGDDRKERMT